MSHTCCSKPLLDNIEPESPTSPQARFNFTYVTVQEIAELVGVTRVAVMNAHRRGILPDPIVVSGNQIHLWERLDVAPFVEAWRTSVATRRRMADIGRRSLPERKGTAEAVAHAFPHIDACSQAARVTMDAQGASIALGHCTFDVDFGNERN